MPRVEVRTYIDQDIRDEWAAKFKYASISFVLETAMRETLEMMKDDPSLEERIRDSIHAHILKNQPQRANVAITVSP